MNPCNMTLLPVYQISCTLITSALCVTWRGFVQITSATMGQLDSLTVVHRAEGDWKFAKINNGGPFQAKDC